MGAKCPQIETEAAPIRNVADLFGVYADSEPAIRWGFLGGIAAAQNGRQGASVFDLLTRLFVVMGLIPSNGQRRSRCVQHFFDDLIVVDLAAVDLVAADGEVQRTAFAVDNGMHFRGPAAATNADRLLFLPFPPLAQRCAFTIVLSMKSKPTHEDRPRYDCITNQ